MAEGTKCQTVVRPAMRVDCAEICRMIMDLAIYEGLQDQAKMTVEGLEEDGFGEEPFYRCLVAENPNYTETDKGSRRLMGYSLYCFIYSTFVGRCLFMEDLYVAPEFRKQGLGTRLMKAVAQIGVDKRCERLCWNVLGWNKTSIAFYKSIGGEDYTEKEDWHGFRMNRAALVKFVAS